MDFVQHCRRELLHFESLLDGDLSVPVKHCGSWDLYRLADHLGRQNLWSAAGITEGHGDLNPSHAPHDPADLKAWFRSTSDTLLEALARDPDSPAWTIYPPATVGFWRRRRAHETLIHRWDAENALGLESSFDVDLAGDGIDEVLDTMLPRQVSLGRTSVPEASIWFEAPGIERRWGAGRPHGRVRGSRERILLLLWGRLPLDSFEIDGDEAAVRAFFAADLVP